MTTHMEIPLARRVDAHALLALDSPALARLLKRGLEEQNFRVDCTTLMEMQPHQRNGDVLVVDVAGAIDDAATLIGIWRREGLRMPIVALTPSVSKGDHAELLRAGASVCLDKPFEFHELLGLLRAVAQQEPVAGAPTFAAPTARDLEIDANAGTVKRDGRTIRLTPRELSLLHLLAAHRGRVVTRQMIREQVYQDKDGSSNVVDVYINYLRNKIDAGSDRPLIQTVWGRGYSLRAADE